MHRRMRLVAWLIVLVGVVVGCATEPVTTDEPAVLARITCADDGAHVQSPAHAATDGVHLMVFVPDRFGLVIRGDPAQALELGPGEFGPMSLDASSNFAVTRVAPGDYTVGCRDNETDQLLPMAAPLTIEDPNGFWLEDRLLCRDRSIGITDYVAGAEGAHGDLLAALRRHVTGLRPGDLVTRAGYPDAPNHEVRVVRDGTVVVVATYELSGPDNWLLGTFAVCASSGITG